MATKKAATKKVAKATKAVKADSAEKKIGSSVVFEVTAIIPTQQYGNIQPKIQVTCSSIEEGRALVMPVIEELYKTYAETPLNGRDPKFYGNITVEEKVVDAPAPAPKVETPDTVSSPAVSEQSSSTSPAPTSTPATKTEPVMKAEKAISLATSKEALAIIRTQIENSVKIDPASKPDLFTQCDAKYQELDVF